MKANIPNQVERIKIKLKLAKNTDTFLEVFGADCHKYELSTPLDINVINEFEKKYEIKLPKEYKLFLTEIGNGSEVTGAGPEIGIKKFGNDLKVLNPNYLKKPIFLNSETRDLDWEKKVYDLKNINENEVIVWGKFMQEY